MKLIIMVMSVQTNLTQEALIHIFITHHTIGTIILAIDFIIK